MKPKTRNRLLLLLSILILLVPPAEAQIRVGLDTEITLRHVHRGLTYRHGVTFGGAPYAAYRAGQTDIVGGYWANLQARAPDLLTDVGFQETIFPERNGWFQVSHPIGTTELTLGLSHYDIAQTIASGPASTAVRTWEGYGILATKRSRFNVSVAAFADLDAVGGVFIRPEFTIRWPLLTRLPVHAHHFELIIGSIFTSLGTGLSFGQEIDPSDPQVHGYYEGSGVTYLDATMTIPVGINVWMLESIGYLTWGYQINIDEQTKVVGLTGTGTDRSGKWILRLGLKIEVPRCRPSKRLCS